MRSVASVLRDADTVVNAAAMKQVPTCEYFPDEAVRTNVGNGMPEGHIEAWLDCLREICEARDAGRLVVALKEIVLDYSPSANLLKHVIGTRGRRLFQRLPEGRAPRARSETPESTEVRSGH